MSVFAMVAMTIGVPLLILCGNPVVELTVCYLPAFLTGVILTRVKPFFKPMVTAPLGSMTLMGIGALQEQGPGWWLRLGFVASIGLVTFFGCLVAKKASGGLGKFFMPWYYSAMTLAVLVCTSSIGCVLWCALEANGEGTPMRPALMMCLWALLLIAAATIANFVLLAFRGRRDAPLR